MYDYGEFMPPLPARPGHEGSNLSQYKPHPKRRPKAPRPINGIQSRAIQMRAPIPVEQQPRDSQGRWVDMALAPITHPKSTGPTNLRRESKPVPRRSTRKKSWGDRGFVGKFIGLFTGEWRRWRRKQLKRRAKVQRKERGYI